MNSDMTKNPRCASGGACGALQERQRMQAKANAAMLASNASFKTRLEEKHEQVEINLKGSATGARFHHVRDDV